MSNRLIKLTDPKISKEEEDRILTEVITAKMNQDLRRKWEHMLEEEYKVTREGRSKVRRLFSSRNTKLLLAIAACIALVIAIPFMNISTTTSQELAQQYLAEQEVLHPGISKGTAAEDEMRVRAIQSFNNQAYGQAAQQFGQLEASNEEDHYYHGLALLLSNRYPEAIEQFEQSEAMNDRFLQELHWYQALAYLLDGNDQQAAEVLTHIQSGDWNYEKAQSLLEKIRK